MAPAAVRVMLLVFIAGCSAPTEPAPEPEQELVAQSDTIAWWLEGCSYHAAFVPVDAAAVAELLPDGYVPVTPGQRGLPDTGHDALFAVEAAECSHGSRLEGGAGATEYAAMWVPVVGNGTVEHRVQWDTLVPDSDQRAWLEDAGAPVFDGEADTYDTLYAGPMHFRDGGVSFAGRGTTVWFGTTLEPYALPSSFTVEQDGARWQADVLTTDVAYGPGALRNNGHPLVQQVVGTDAFAWIVRADLQWEGNITLSAA